MLLKNRSNFFYFFVKHLDFFFLVILIFAVYYKFFLAGRVPFPGDLLIGSYFPWLDYYKMPVQNPIISDSFSQFFIWKYFAIEQFKHLKWPFWNPYSFAGTPLLSTYHSAVLYPLNLLLLLPKYYGWGFYIFSQTFLAAINMYFFLTLWTQSKLSRIAGAIIFALGGLMTTWLELGTADHAMAYLPLNLYFIEKFLKKAKIKYLFFISFALSFTILAGNAQISIYSFLIIITYCLFRLFQQGKHFFLKLIPILFSMLFSILLSAPQLLTSFDFLSHSIRTTDVYIKEYNYGLLKLDDFLKFFIGDFFGNPITRNYWGFLNYSETSGFVSSLSLILLIYAATIAKQKKIIYFFIGVLLTSICLAFDNPLSKFIYLKQIPLLTQSFASRILFITTFSIAVLSALSINDIIGNVAFYKKITKPLAFSVAIFTGIVLGIIISEVVISWITNFEKRPFYQAFLRQESEKFIYNYTIALKHAVVPLILVIILSFLLIILQRVKKFTNFSNIFSIVLVMMITLELSSYFLKFNPFIKNKFVFPQTPSLTFLKNQPQPFRVGREPEEILPPNTWMAYNLESFEGYDPLYLKDYGKYINFLNGGDLRENSNAGRYAELSSRKYTSPFLDLLNDKYFIAIIRKEGHPQNDGDVHYTLKESGFKTIFTDKSTAILENPHAFSRFYFPNRFKIANLEQMGNIIMTDKNFNPKQEVLLAEDLGVSNITGKGEITLVDYKPNEVKLTTKTKTSEILILNDQFDSNWHALLDNQETKVTRANYIFRAIKVPSGNHNILFYYWPSSFYNGLKISAIAIILLVILALFQKRINKLFKFFL